MERKEWNEFRQTGLLWFINSILHLFRWAIVLSYNDNDNTYPIAYPARVPFRGFDENCNDRGYREVTQYLNDNIGDLLKEVNDETDG